MKLKDIKRKDGEGLLPEEKKAHREQQGYLECYADGYNDALSELSEKELFDYIEIDVEKAAESLHNGGLNAYTHPQSNSGEDWNTYRLELAQALVKAFPIKVKEE